MGQAFIARHVPITTNQGHTKQDLKRTMKVGKMGLNEEEEEDVQDNLGQI